MRRRVVCPRSHPASPYLRKHLAGFARPAAFLPGSRSTRIHPPVRGRHPPSPARHAPSSAACRAPRLTPCPPATPPCPPVAVRLRPIAPRPAPRAAAGGHGGAPGPSPRPPGPPPYAPFAGEDGGLRGQSTTARTATAAISGRQTRPFGTAEPVS